jgi:hypothetical protein
MSITYDNLFKYLEEKCNFRKRKSDGEIIWNCDGQLTFTKQFCDDNKLNFKTVEDMVKKYGGYCDCEVLFNAVERIDEKIVIPRLE